MNETLEAYFLIEVIAYKIRKVRPQWFCY